MGNTNSVRYALTGIASDSENSKDICMPFNDDTVDYDFVVSRLWSFHPYASNLELDLAKRKY